MWIFDRITTHNFGILGGEQTVELGDKSIVGIRAEYESDATRSNRGGKTTWIEAFKYALTGDCRSKKEVQMITHGEKVMWVEVVLKHVDTGETRVIRRGRDHKNHGLLTIDWIEKVADAQAEINELLGLDNDFDLTNNFRQSDIHGFMEKDPAEKGALLTKWVTKGHWKEKELEATADRNHIKALLKDNESVQRALESAVEVTEPLVAELSKVRQQRVEKAAEIETATQARQKLYVEFQQKKTAKAEAKSVVEELDQRLSQVLKAEQAHEKNQEALRQYEKQLKELSGFSGPFHLEKLKQAQQQLMAAKFSTDALELKRQRAKKVGKPTCPILDESCDRISFGPDFFEKIEYQIVESEQIAKGLESQVESLEEEKAKHEQYNLLLTKIKSLRTIAEAKLSESSVEVRRKLSKAVKQGIEDLTPFVSAIKELDATIKTWKVELTAIDQTIGELEHRIKASNEALARVDEVARRSAELRAKLEDLNYVVFMFSRNGIPANEIENAFGDVENNINYVLDGMECGFNINFSPDRELDKWEPVCHCGFVFPKGYRKAECQECGSLRQKQRKAEINIEVVENGEAQDFAQDSGGGKTIVSYAVRIGITMLKRDQNKNKLSVLFLDELDSALDPYFVKQITSSITKVLTKKLGFGQIFMVSHKSSIRDAVPDILQVTRGINDRSTIEWAT